MERSRRGMNKCENQRNLAAKRDQLIGRQQFGRETPARKTNEVNIGLFLFIAAPSLHSPSSYFFQLISHISVPFSD